jgi:hypothetical protein
MKTKFALVQGGRHASKLELRHLICNRKIIVIFTL